MSIAFLTKAKSEILVCDGAMGTMLQSLGLPQGHCPEEWNLSQPEKVASVHRSYVEAGADLIQTNTFGANRAKLERDNMASKIAEFNRLAVQLAKEAGEVSVLGDIGPTGHLLKPYGELDFSEAVDIFAEQVAALSEARVDALIIETFVALEEIQAALKAAKENTDLPVICTMSFDKGGVTVMGVSGDRAAAALLEAGADVVGANCGSSPEDMLKALTKMREVDSEALLIAQPNAGVPKLVEGKTVFDMPPEELAQYAHLFVELGVNIVGSCCGSTPEHTAAIVRAVKR